MEYYEEVDGQERLDTEQQSHFSLDEGKVFLEKAAWEVSLPGTTWLCVGF